MMELLAMYIQEVVEQEVTESSTNRQHTLSFLLSLGAAMMELLTMYIQEVVVVVEEDLLVFNDTIRDREIETDRQTDRQIYIYI